jgi:hypothetical protein
MIKPKTIGIHALAARWEFEPKQIIEAAIDGQIKLYFRPGYCVIAYLPNPRPGSQLQRRPYEGSLQADKPTLNALCGTNEARDVKEAYTPEGAWVHVELPAQEFSPNSNGNIMQMPVQLSQPLNIKAADLHAFMEDVEACERDEHKPAVDPSNRGSNKPAAETTAQRRIRWLNLFDEEKKRGERGALQRVADRERVDRSNMKKDIDKARAFLEEQRRGGLLVGQMVQAGKRSG